MADPIFGYDVSEHQPGFDHAKAYAEGYRFVMARTSQGATYKDKWFRRHMAAIQKTRLLFAAYHYVGTTPPAAQASAVVGMINDTSVPVFLDSELGSGDEAMNYRVAQEIRKRGHRVIGNYLPPWYWSQIGKPNLRVGPLWCSRYVDGNDFGSTLYGKVTAADWDGYGGQQVAILQFTSKAKIAGVAEVDASAYRGTLADLTAMFTGNAAPAPKPAPAPAPAPAPVALVTTLAGTPLDLSDLPKGAGPRFKFRDRLTNVSGAYPGCVCDCIPRFVALVEALAKEAGLHTPLTFWEGSYIVTANSGQTHAGGGAFDININGLTAKQVDDLVRVVRYAGGAAWLRNKAHGNFSTPHIHVEVIGCDHASADARAQWTDYKNGRDGLAAHGPDYGPKVAYITADAAYKALTKTATATPSAKGGLVMANPTKFRRTKDQQFAKSRDWHSLKIDDSNDKAYSIATGPATVDILATINSDQDVWARFITMNWKPGTAQTATAYPKVKIPAGGGQIALYDSIGGPAKGYKQKIVRLQICPVLGATVTDVEIRVGKES